MGIILWNKFPSLRKKKVINRIENIAIKALPRKLNRPLNMLPTPLRPIRDFIWSVRRLVGVLSDKLSLEESLSA